MSELIRKTPLVFVPRSKKTPGHGPLGLKLECLQTTGSFKVRGAAYAIAALSREDLTKGVVTASAGNHGAGLALAAGDAQVKATVFVPAATPKNKCQRIRSLGAELVVAGDDYDASEALAREFSAKTRAHFVSAFDDDDVIAGNGGTLGREILAQCSNVARVVVPVGGGGLIAGLANVLVPLGVEVVGVQPKNNCAMVESLALGTPLCEYTGKRTIAEGCEGAVCERTFAVVLRHGLSIVTVAEEDIRQAMRYLYRDCGVVAEASGAVSVAGWLSGVVPPVNGTTISVVSGGNVDDAFLSEVLADA